MSEIGGRFLTGSTMGHVVRMTVAGSIGITFMFLVDVANLFWVSLLGVERLIAALGFAWTIQFFSVSFGIGIMVATTAVVSRQIGQGRRDEARRQTTVCAISAFIIQLVVASLILIYRFEILYWAGAEGQTAIDAARYLLISVMSLPIMALGMVGSAVLRAEGDAWRAMMVTFVSGLVSMVIDPLLIFGLGLGLDGAALAIGIARLLSACLSVYFVMRVHDLVGSITWPDFRRLFFPFALVALPVLLTQLSTPFGNYVVTTVISEFGDGAVAGWAVVSRLTVLAFGGLFALSSAIGGIFGQNYGAERFDRVTRTYRDALIFCIVYTLLAWAVLAMATDLIVAGFGLGQEASQVISAFALLAAGAYVFYGAQYVAGAAFNSLGRPVYSTILNWVRDGMLLWPLAGLMTGWYAAAGAIYGYALAGVIAGIVSLVVAWVFVIRLGRAAEQPKTA